MDETRRDAIERAGLAPNRLAHVRSLPEAGFTAVVRPNADTLYSIAWLELGAVPLQLDIPAMEGRYWLFGAGCVDQCLCRCRCQDTRRRSYQRTHCRA